MQWYRHEFRTDDFDQVVQLYPEESLAGQYAGNFRPTLPGAYGFHEVSGWRNFGAREFPRVSESGEEAVDVSFARLDLQMLAKLTGGQYLTIDEMRSDWEPNFAVDLPSVRKRHSLINLWVIFILLWGNWNRVDFKETGWIKMKFLYLTYSFTFLFSLSGQEHLYPQG